MLRKNLSLIIGINTIKNLPIIILLLIILGFSIYTVIELKKEEQPGTIEALKEKLAAHEELTKYTNQYPRITYITDNFLQQAKANNLIFFENAKNGNYFLEYVGASVIYDPKKDSIVNMQEFETAPADLLSKATDHPELTDYKGITPIIIKINKDNLANLQQQIAGIDESYIGNYILNYNDRLTIYDYENDQIKGLFDLQG